MIVIKYYAYIIWITIVGIISVFTGELVTFTMLGVVVMALQNILVVQKKILARLEQQDNNKEI